MKISKFGVTAVGRLANVELTLGKGMHILYGPNETGKSTLLHLYIDMLFGGSPANREWFETASKLYLEVESEGKLTTFRRKQYRRQLISVDENWQPVEECLLSLIGIEKARYMQLYGFNHERLRTGGQSLLQNGGDAGISLFEAGSGVSHIQRLLNQYKARLNELFQPRMRKDAAALLNKSLRIYQEARDKQREHTLRPSVWAAERKQVEAAKQKVDELYQTLQQLRHRQAKLQRIDRNRATYQRYKQISEELACKEVRDYLTAQAEADVTDTVHEYRRLQDAVQKEREKLQDEQRKLHEIQYNHDVIALTSEFEALRDEFSLYQTARQEQGQLSESLTALESALARQIEFVRTDLPLTQSISLEHRTSLQALLAEYEGLQKEIEIQQRALEDGRQGVVSMQERLAQMPTVPDLTFVREKIQAWHRQGISSSRARELRQKYEQQMQEIKQLSLRNRLWQGDVMELANLPLPMMETLQAYAVQFAKLAQRREELDRDVTKVQGQYELHLSERTSLEHKGTVPTEQELFAVRKHRDEGWRLIKKKLVTPKLVPLETAAFVEGSETLEDAYERVVQQADGVADRLRREADRVAKLAELNAQLEREEREIARLEQESSHVLQQEQGLGEKWQSEWLASGVKPLSPPEMIAWMQTFAAPLKQRLTEAGQLRREVEALEQACDEAQDQIRNWLSIYPLQMHEGACQSLDDQLAVCENELRELERIRFERTELQHAISQQQEKLNVISAQLDDMTGKRSTILQAYQAILSIYPYLPTEIQFVRTYLGELDELWDLQLRVDKERRQINQKAQIVEQFEARVKSVVQKLPTHFRPDDGDILLLYANLQRLYEKTREEHQHYKQQNSMVRAQEERVASLTSDFDRVRGKLSDWLTKTGLQGETDLLQFVETSRRYRELVAARTQLEEAMLAAGDGRTLEELAEEIGAVEDMDALPGEIQSLADRISEIEDEQGKEQVRYGELKKAFGQYDGLADAALVYRQESVAAAQEVSGHWEEVVQVQVKLKILEAAMNIYRNQSQSGILESASSLFSRMTLGAYKGIELDDDTDSPRLLAVRTDGKNCAFSELSDGTLDQLYFSLRLAFLSTQAKNATVLPFVLDDVFVHFDDARAAETLRILDEISDSVQILYFTHHEHFIDKVVAGAGLQHTTTHHLTDYIEYR